MPTNTLSNILSNASLHASLGVDVPLEDALNAMPQKIAIVNKNAVIIHANSAWLHFADNRAPLYAKLGADYLNVCKNAQHSVRSAGAVQPDAICRGFYNVLKGVSEQFTLEYSCFTNAGERWFVMHVKPLQTGTGGAVISHVDVTSRRHYEEEMARVAYTDALTDLPNRRAFFERAKQMIAAAKRRARELHLLYIDLDGFKCVNDSLGHDAGDTLLVEVAGRFKSQVRESDLLARLGGDEFACLLEVRGDDDATQVAARYASSLDLPFRLSGQEVRIGASIGVAHFPHEGSTLRTLLRGADRKMYENKRSERVAAAMVGHRQWTCHKDSEAS